MEKPENSAQIEERLKDMCKRLDEHLEDAYGFMFSIHPNRPARGKAANPAYDGLFSTGIMFTLGFGSKLGRGYIVDIQMRTLDNVPAEKKTEITENGIAFMRSILPEYFDPEDFSVEKDGSVYKFTGPIPLSLA